MQRHPLLEEDIEVYVRERARALAVIDRVRELAFAVFPLSDDRAVQHERDRHAIVEAIASLYARRRARAHRERT
jgi:hypothetical protein